MAKNINILLLGLFSILFSSCIKDGEIPCPEEKVTFLFYAEKFQNKSQIALDDREDKFCDRIQHVRYYLYKDNVLIEEKEVNKFNDTQASCFTLEYTGLVPGSYELIAVGNSTRTALGGDPVKASNLVLTYPGYADTEDYFYSVFPFTVKAEEVKTYEVGLSRAHGVVRYRFINLPDDVAGIGVMVKNVGTEKWITGDFTNAFEAGYQYAINKIATRQEVIDLDNDYIIGTFPSPTDENSSFHLSLFRDGQQEPYFSQMIADTLAVTRNQLIDIITTFNGDEVNFEVVLDNVWDGSHLGGIGEVK